MQRIVRLASCRELSGLAGRSPDLCAWKRGRICSRKSAMHRQWAEGCARPFSGESGAQGRRMCRQRFVMAGQTLRQFSSEPGADGPQGNRSGQPAISVVGIPDPITFIRCKVIMYLTKLYFDVDINSVEFDRGVKQALVHVSNLMASGRYHRLVDIVSSEMMEHVEKKCRSLSDAQRQQLAVTMDDIVFVLPEDVSVVFDQYDRKFCFVVMRFWILSTHEGPDDPEGTKMFKVAPSKDGGPQKKMATAVYEFQRELTRGASPDWTVTTVWHWQWKAAE
uniref:m-AAA protease-interacting protein 1, mitochondrial n=1 Tax=Scatophagus argus TaxID=75038 RepID=UPI001ED7DB1A|nr:m-AAA protease-interacting protein 1, mitochondrial [Scatophagus argus]